MIPALHQMIFLRYFFDWLLFSRQYNLAHLIRFPLRTHVYLQTNFMHFNASMDLYQITGATFLDIFFREVIRAMGACST